jgi:ribosomal-protein-alanine acetyltransferase
MPKPTTNKPKIAIQKAEGPDIEAVYNIEIEESSHPWKKSYFLAEISNDISYFFICRDLESGDIAGYIVSWIIEDILEIHNLAVKEPFKRRGIATALLNFMVTLARQEKVKEMFLEVRESNQNAVALYKKLGFKLKGRRKDYYNNPPEDALIYSKILPLETS